MLIIVLLEAMLVDSSWLFWIMFKATSVIALLVEAMLVADTLPFMVTL